MPPTDCQQPIFENIEGYKPDGPLKRYLFGVSLLSLREYRLMY